MPQEKSGLDQGRRRPGRVHSRRRAPPESRRTSAITPSPVTGSSASMKTAERPSWRPVRPVDAAQRQRSSGRDPGAQPPGTTHTASPVPDLVHIHPHLYIGYVAYLLGAAGSSATTGRKRIRVDEAISGVHDHQSSLEPARGGGPEPTDPEGTVVFAGDKFRKLARRLRPTDLIAAIAEEWLQVALRTSIGAVHLDTSTYGRARQVGALNPGSVLRAVFNGRAQGDIIAVRLDKAAYETAKGSAVADGGHGYLGGHQRAATTISVTDADLTCSTESERRHGLPRRSSPRTPTACSTT